VSDRKRKAEPEETESAVVEEPEAASVGAAEEPAEEAVAEAPVYPKGEPINGDAMLVDAAAIIKEDAHAEPGPGEVKLVYLGIADAFEHGGRVFRPDQPVIVPSEVAEDLLTYPNEQFAEVKE
jgi:hypothetical protein